MPSPSKYISHVTFIILFAGLIATGIYVRNLDRKTNQIYAIVASLQWDIQQSTKMSNETFSSDCHTKIGHFTLALTTESFLPDSIDYSYTISNNGILTTSAKREGQTLFTNQAKLSQAEIRLIINQIELNNFFKLNQFFRRDADDGGERSIEIVLNDQKNKVTVTNCSVPEVDRIVNVVVFISRQNSKP